MKPLNIKAFHLEDAIASVGIELIHEDRLFAAAKVKIVLDSLKADPDLLVRLAKHLQEEVVGK